MKVSINQVFALMFGISIITYINFHFIWVSFFVGFFVVAMVSEWK